jgi:hypothetical protein
MRYYVYALIDPTNNDIPFYIGKGINNRIKQHFIEATAYDAENNIEEPTIDSILEIEIGEVQNNTSISPKIKKIKELLNQGYCFTDIGRILAKDLDEATAFAIEALLIKTIYGINNLTNLVEGEHTERFRPYNNWSCIEGFDLTSSNKTRYSQDRSEKLKMMLSEGIDKPLLKIKEAFPFLSFDESQILDSGELGIEANIKNTRIKIFIRWKNIQIELRGRNKAQHLWLQQHFLKLDAKHVLRGDNVFLPNAWKGSKNMTSNVEEAINRANLLIEIINTENNNMLSEEAKQLLL